jgi:hypothetical protein
MDSKLKTRVASLFPVINLVLATTLLLAEDKPVYAADIINQQFVGEFSVSYFEFPGPSECSKIIVYIFGNNQVSKQSKASADVTSIAEATYILFDECSGQYPITANGSEQYPGKSGVHIYPSLTQARLNSDFSITEFQTQASIPVSINAVWTGVGPTFSQKIMSHNIGSGSVFNGRYIGSFRTAIPSGTITFGTTTYDLTKASYMDSYFGVANSGFISITR